MRGIHVFVWLVMLGLAHGFRTAPKPVGAQQCVDRRDLFGLVLPGMALGSFGLSAQAKGNKGGTKDDPKYEGCLSNCVYYCTKPKGNEQKTRGECLPDCKKQCAKTDAQLMLGRPKE